VGKSARGRKGTSVGAVRAIWQHAQPIVGSVAWKPGPLSSGEGLIYAVRDALGSDPGASDKRLFLVEGEFGAALRAMRREGNTLSTTLRSAWDGQTLEPLTKNNPMIATNPHIGIVGHITEQELKSQLGQGEYFNGFANRHLWWCVRRSKHIPLAEGLPKAEAERLGERYATQLIMARSLNEIVFSPSARRQYEAVYRELMAEHDGLYGLVISRSEIQVIRVALIYACLDGCREIGEDHLEAGLAAIDYCEASARRLFGGLAHDPRETKILEALSKGEKSTTDLHLLFGGHCKAGDLANLLATLEAKGAIVKVIYPTGGRDREVYKLAKEAKEEKEGQPRQP
jgi:hypothetical protein